MTEEIESFTETVQTMHDTSSRNELKEMVRDCSEAELRIILGEWTDAGVGKRTVQKAVNNVFDSDDVDTSDQTIEEALMGECEITQAGFTEYLQAAPGTLDDVIEDLETLRNTSGNELVSTLTTMFRVYDEPWILPFALLGDYSTGISDTTVAKAYFPEQDHNRIKALNQNLPAVTAGDEKPQTAVQAGSFLRPELASSKDIPSDTSDWVFEPKLDGNRLLIHWDGETATAQTRRLNDVTHSLPELQEIDWPDNDLVLDCEVIAEDGSYVSTSERIGAKEFDREQDMEFHVFDCLHVDGTDITDQSYTERRAVCEAHVPVTSDYVELTTQYETLDEAISKTSDIEGFIAKRTTSQYQLGKRSHDWRKQKHIYETADVRIVGFSQGNGRHSDTLGTVTIESKDGVALGECGSGFSDEQREMIWNSQDEYYNSIIEVQFAGYNDHLREPTFQRFRPNGEPDSLERIKRLAE